MILIGIDLAWGEKKRDGVCAIEAKIKQSRVLGYDYPQGDDALVRCVENFSKKEKGVFLTIDAPIVCPNVRGTRPVDRLTHRMFHQEHAACHPAYLEKCPRPARVLKRLEKIGFQAGWNISAKQHTACEVYPHPAMVRLFELPRIIKYKKGSVADRRKEFQRLQRCLTQFSKKHFPELEIGSQTKTFLKTSWDKETEDHLDAFFCALIGLWRWKYGENRSEVIGDLKTGFILLPNIKGK
ncbi:MAG: DUF429 domain-containing protein [Verrucomicrobiota bacterium]